MVWEGERKMYLIGDVVTETVEGEDAEKLGREVLAPQAVAFVVGGERETGFRNPTIKKKR